MRQGARDARSIVSTAERLLPPTETVRGSSFLKAFWKVGDCAMPPIHSAQPLLGNPIHPVRAAHHYIKGPGLQDFFASASRAAGWLLGLEPEPALSESLCTPLTSSGNALRCACFDHYAYSRRHRHRLRRRRRCPAPLPALPPAQPDPSPPLPRAILVSDKPRSAPRASPGRVAALASSRRGAALPRTPAAPDA